MIGVILSLGEGKAVADSAFALAARAQQSAVMGASAYRKTRRTGQEIAVGRALACANYA